MTFCHGYFPSVVWYNYYMDSEYSFGELIGMIELAIHTEAGHDGDFSNETHRILNDIEQVLAVALDLPPDYSPR